MGAQKALRGAHLARRGPGARGLLRMAELDCELQAAVSISCADLVDVYRQRWEALPPAQRERVPKEPVGSDLANWLGQRWENRLWADKAKLLREMYAEHVDPAMQDAKVIYIGGPPLSEEKYDELAGETDELLADRQRGERPACLVANATVRMPFGEETVYIQPDILVGLPGRPFAVGEVKVYLDRSSRTDPDELGRACFQAAVGIAAIESSERLGTKVEALSEAHIILRRGPRPSLRALDVSDEVATVHKLAAQVPARAEQLLRGLLGRPLRSVGHHWTPLCASLCDLEPTCRPADTARHAIETARADLAITAAEWAAAESELG